MSNVILIAECDQPKALKLRQRLALAGLSHKVQKDEMGWHWKIAEMI